MTAQGGEWDEQIRFYASLINDHGWRQEPMLTFVKWLAESSYATWMHPSNSHAALGLSTALDYPDRRKRPMIYVGYDNTADAFQLTFQEGQGNTVRSEWVTSPTEPRLMNQIVDWLLRDVLFDR